MLLDHAMLLSAPMRTFRTWSGVHRSVPSRWERPASEAELAEILSSADRAGRRLRPIGSGHSWSDIAVPDDGCLDLGAMRAVLQIDAAAGTARVQAGIRLEEINETLAAAGLALPILGSIAKQTIAGAISTGTHGSSLVHGNLSSLVLGMRLVTARGEILDLREGDPRLAAARVGLGALGIISEVTLRCVPAFRLEEEREPMPIDAVLAELPALAASAEYVKIWWIPGTRRAQVFRHRRTPLPDASSAIAHALDERLVNQVLFEAALRLCGRYPALTPRINAVVVSTYFRRGRRIARSDRGFRVAMPPIHRECEYSVALEHAAPLLREVDAAIRREGLVVNFPCEIRFVRADDAWMSPAFGRDSCQIGFYQAQSPHLARYFVLVEALAQAVGARPHWGKEFSMDRASILAAYPRSADFLALRRALDPNGTLGNRFTDRVLGPP